MTPHVSEAFAVVLGARMLLTAAVVVGASFAVERVGPFVGAMIATLPLSAGPAYLFLALDHDAAFVASSAIGSLLSVAASSCFLVVYVMVAPRLRTAPSLAIALGIWIATLLLLHARTWTLPEALAAMFLAAIGGAVATRNRRRLGIAASIPARPWHIALRAVAVMALVLAVMVLADLFGPHAAGLASLVPIVFTSLIAILQPRLGGDAVASVMANSLLGMVGYGFALGLLNLTAIPLGKAAALILALAACCGWNGLLLLRRRHA